MREIWKDIDKYEGLYKISNIGRVKSFHQNKNGNILKNNKGNHGYLRTSLSKNGKSKKYLIHRLVGKAFIKNPKNKKTINHLNGIKTDNRVENLEWATYSENNRHARTTGLNNQFGETSDSSKLTKDNVFEIKLLLRNTDMTQGEIARKFDVHAETVGYIKRGKSWKHITID